MKRFKLLFLMGIISCFATATQAAADAPDFEVKCDACRNAGPYSSEICTNCEFCNPYDGCSRHQ